jgi:hypothetical protein
LVKYSTVKATNFAAITGHKFSFFNAAQNATIDRILAPMDELLVSVSKSDTAVLKTFNPIRYIPDKKAQIVQKFEGMCPVGNCIKLTFVFT